MIRYFNSLGIRDHDRVLYDMGVKEKEHEVYFLEVTRDEPWLSWFEGIFSWGVERGVTDLDFNDLYPVDNGDDHCPAYKAKEIRSVSDK